MEDRAPRHRVAPALAGRAHARAAPPAGPLRSAPGRAAAYPAVAAGLRGCGRPHGRACRRRRRRECSGSGGRLRRGGRCCARRCVRGISGAPTGRSGSGRGSRGAASRRRRHGSGSRCGRRGAGCGGRRGGGCGGSACGRASGGGRRGGGRAGRCARAVRRARWGRRRERRRRGRAGRAAPAPQARAHGRAGRRRAAGAPAVRSAGGRARGRGRGEGRGGNGGRPGGRRGGGLPRARARRAGAVRAPPGRAAQPARPGERLVLAAAVSPGPARLLRACWLVRAPKNVWLVQRKNKARAWWAAA